MGGTGVNRRGVVVEVNGNAAIVEVERRAMCSSCEKNTSGGGCELCGLISSGGGKMRAEALNKAGAVPGDTVELETESKTVLAYAALVFILPLAVSALFYFAAFSVFRSDGTGIACAAVGFVLSYAALIVFEKRRKKKTDITIVKVVEEKEKH